MAVFLTILKWLGIILLVLLALILVILLIVLLVPIKYNARAAAQGKLRGDSPNFLAPRRRDSSCCFSGERVDRREDLRQRHWVHEQT